MNKEQFRAQFNTRVTLSDDLASAISSKPEAIIHNYPVFRCLEKLLLLDNDGQYYARFDKALRVD